MRLISDVHLGFETKPFLRTVVTTLDLSSAFNRVDHLKLLDLFDKLGIPPVYGRFYRSFLSNRIFKVRYRNHTSQWAKESCGTPQGTVSSPFLFIIYMEGMLRTIMPTANRLGIQVAMFADDFTLWNTGYSIPTLASNLSILINNDIVPWTLSYNMSLSIAKCHSFLFTQYYRDPKPSITIAGTPLSYGSTPTHNYLNLLGVHLDSHLTMKFHLENLRRKSLTRLRQLSRVSNSIFGIDQADLRTMYIAYIRSVLEYAAPAWSACMSRTNLAALQRLQNQALRIILGVRLSTRIDALHYEANLPPLMVRYQFSTAYYAEKYRRHPPSDPLYIIAHQSLPNQRLKRSSWQFESDRILISAGFHPSRNDDHRPCPTSLISLHSRHPIIFIPCIAPWTSRPSHIHVQPTIPNLNKKNPAHICRTQANTTLSHLPPFDYSFWTDGSLLQSGQASSVCMAYAVDDHPTKRRRLAHTTYILARPAGFVSSPILAEKQALELVSAIINSDPIPFSHKRIFIGSDCQTGLRALAEGPLRDYAHSCTHLNWSSTYQTYLDTATNYDCHFHLQYIPAHVGIEPNETVDLLAKHYASTFSPFNQLSANIDLSALKSALKRSLIQQWINTTPLLGTRYEVCGLKRSNLKQRRSMPRALQCLYSRWRVGEIETVGIYPRRLGWISSPLCRLCGYPSETTVHLLTACPGTYPTRASLGISFDTLVIESPDNIIRIARFDAWLRSVLPLEQLMATQGISAILRETMRKRKVHHDTLHASYPLQKRTKRQHYLVIPQPVTSAVNNTKTTNGSSETTIDRSKKDP
jgi:hypothetical protein